MRINAQRGGRTGRLVATGRPSAVQVHAHLIAKDCPHEPVAELVKQVVSIGRNDEQERKLHNTVSIHLSGRKGIGVHG